MAKTREVPPLVVPEGVRLALRLEDGRELPVTLYQRRPCTTMGECPRLPPRPRREDPDAPDLFAGVAGAVPGARGPDRQPGAVIVVYAATRHDLDKAHAVNNHPDLRPYPSEVRTDPATQE